MANKETKKTMDVAKPGKTAPDTSARPVIVTHRPMVQDPMVKTDDAETEAGKDTTPEPAKTSHSKVIQPPSEAAAETSEAAPETPETPAEEPAKPAEAAAKPAESTETEAAVVDAVADQAEAGETKKKTGELTPEQKAKQESLQKQIVDKKYFVPIGQATRRRQNRRASLILVVLVLLIGVYLALDAEVIKIGVKLPLDIIKN